jgi:hypothetical protein
MNMKRRDFVKSAVAIAATSQMPRSLHGLTSAQQVEIAIHTERPGLTVPADFTGLSYESAQLAHPQFFSPANHELVGLVKRLSPEGVLRIGGNTSEFTVWTPQAGASADRSFAEPPSAGKNTAESYAITPESVRNLRGFLDATGWRLIYGLNLARGTPQAAADEAAFVVKTMGDKLVALQFGNEPDLFHYHADPANNSAWTFQEYAEKWLQFEKAVRARLPHVPLAGPDAAYRMDWVTQFADQMRGKVQLLTGHYYIGGPPSNPDMNIAALMTPPRHLLEEIPQTMAAAKVAGVPYRMAEGNSCYQGGKLGVSDTFASALWVGDYMLQLAQAGYAGVNLHGGGEGKYTPIATDAKGSNSARPEYYGILLAQMFAGAQFVACDVKAAGANVTAYAAQKDGKALLAVFNKQAEPVNLRVQSLWPQDASKPELWWLRAPSVDSKTGVTLAGSTVDSIGGFKAMPVPAEKPGSFTMGPYTAVLVRD